MRLGGLYFATLLAAAGMLPAQPVPDNRGREFVVGFMDNIQRTGAGVTSTLFITGDVATTGTVSIPGSGFLQNFSVTPGTITSVSLPANSHVLTRNTAEGKGVLVTANADISVYGLNQSANTTDAFLGLPTDILGTEHITSNIGGGFGFGSEFLIVGVQDNTTVTITPKQAAFGHPAGVPFNVILHRLQTYQVTSATTTEDLTGTLITSDKPIALFSGHSCAQVPPGIAACDHLVEQIPATGSWGQSFLTVPLATRTAGDLFRVIVRDNGTQISINGVVAGTRNRGEFLESQLSSSTFNLIETSAPAMLMQYSKGSQADGVTSDPFMMMIPPTEQFQRAYTLTTPGAQPISFNNFLNIVVRSGETGTCRLDGAPIPGTFTPIGTTGFSGIRVPVAIGAHTVSCPSGNGVYSYGFASFDSYGYPGGLALRFIASPRCDVDQNGRVDSRDVSLIFAARNQPSNGPEDPRDFDGDLTITVADARACTLRCTSPNCAIN